MNITAATIRNEIERLIPTTATQTDLQAARRVVWAPEAFSKTAVRLAVKLVLASPEADEEDRYWADMASDI